MVLRRLRIDDVAVGAALEAISDRCLLAALDDAREQAERHRPAWLVYQEMAAVPAVPGIASGAGALRDRLRVDRGAHAPAAHLPEIACCRRALLLRVAELVGHHHG